ncbi:transient receptor potential cation channel subfamily V member 1 [Stegastes partitus]|uniref:Transient receptor potential cation channel subfamily V member 1-like n=1 Tax=Stegastes partitus TaxID=144197 RepID=A0A3B5B2U8_9TELE|nr:PREDICTED: transient receptor potential cation channel subfamily V member 1-like [Stegastes partitus]XP_008305128.1 PREDICTED: transient receptor potential cation channel subfamily V member 1-like [Stegastes partitus]
MKKSEMFGFTLEADDRTEEEKSQRKAGKKDGFASALGLGQDGPKAPMDTDYQEEMEETKPQIRFNLNFDKGIRGEQQTDSRRDSKTFNIDRLFEAVASRDVTKLDGLHQYLHQNMKKLSDSLYQSYGKTALMKALLHIKDGKNETIDVLIAISESMGDIKEFVNAAFTSNYYRGQTALHIAIERRSLPYVKLLVSKGADVHAKACGKFFQQHDGPNFYFGELPLSLAACTNQPDVVDFLMENEFQRADAKLRDSQGNTVLHALVLVADNSKENTEFITSIYDHILKTSAQLHPKLKLDDIENHKGLTPLKMAAKTGKIGLFSHILQREFQESHTKHLSRKFTEWVYGPVHCSLYDLASLDLHEDKSVIEILVYSSDIPNRHEMLETEPLIQLLEKKWKKFAGRMFFFNFLVYLLYLIIFTVVAYNKKNGPPPFPIEHNTWGYLYVSGQLLITLANIYFFFIGIIDMKRKHPKLQTLLIDGYYEILFFVQGVLFLASAGLYLCGRQEYLGFLVLCLALSWLNLLYYSRGDRHMGIYSVMIQKMILSDILRFLFVYIVFLFGFSAAVVTLLIEPPVKNTTRPKKGRFFDDHGQNDADDGCLKPSYRNISYTTLQLFKFTIGMGDMEFTQGYQYKEIFYVLLIGYIILTYILLLNMLIALMNRTVEKITMESASIWKLQRAVTILDMEKRLPNCLQKRFRCGVEIKLGTALGDDRRQCFRVEEVNWNKWNINLGKINEDPGCWDRVQLPAPDTPPSLPRGRSWRGLLPERSRRWRAYQSTETSSSPV